MANKSLSLIVLAVTFSSPAFAAQVTSNAVSGANPRPQAVSGANPRPQAVSGANPRPQAVPAQDGSVWATLLTALGL